MSHQMLPAASLTKLVQKLLLMKCVSIHPPVKRLCVCVFAYIAAPSQPPGNIEWSLTNSKIFLNWEHVKALENESEVTGYKVSLSK